MNLSISQMDQDLEASAASPGPKASCLLTSGSAQQTAASRWEVRAGQLEPLRALSGWMQQDHTESILLQQSSDVFQAKTQSEMFWPKGNIYNQIIHLGK